MFFSPGGLSIIIKSRESQCIQCGGPCREQPGICLRLQPGFYFHPSPGYAQPELEDYAPCGRVIFCRELNQEKSLSRFARNEDYLLRS